ncbi:MAG: hypothetical protein ACJ798_05750 [Phenylobacterium sp.]
MSEPSTRKRRLPLRWLTLAEFVGIVAVVIAALGYWDSHRERTLTERERIAQEREHQAQARVGAAKPAFLMTGASEGSGDRIRLTAVHPDQVIQTQSLSLPSEVRGEAVETTGNPRIEAGWLEGGLEKSLHARRLKQTRGRVPVGIVSVYIEDGQPKTDRAIYLLGYSLHPRVLRSAKVELEGLSLLRRGVGEDVQKAVDAQWDRMAPKPAG